MFNLSTPKMTNFSSKSILKFIEELEKYKVNIHSFCISVDNNIASIGYWKPFNENDCHRMFSVSKSFTSMAIGLLIGEGKISLEDKICNLMPEKTHENKSKFINEMTVKSLLTMTSAHNDTTYKKEKGLHFVDSFFQVKETNKPNSFFSYDTSSSHCLAYIVEKYSGMPLLEYLKLKLSDLEFSQNSKFILDSDGVSLGGTGLVAKMEDIHKLAYLVMNKGIVNGKELIPKSYIEEATKKQVSTEIAGNFDERFGYGFQIWKAREDGFAFIGLGGQLAICYPKEKIILTATADTRDTSGETEYIFRAFWDILVEDYKEKKIDTEMDFIKLQNKLEILNVFVPQNENIDIFKKLINKYTVLDNPTINNFKISIKNNSLFIDLYDKNDCINLKFGINNYCQCNFNLKEYANQTTYAYGYANYLENNSFSFTLKIHGDIISQIKITLTLFDNEFAMRISSYGLDDLNKDATYINGYYHGNIN